eukprot:CAMPEP_0114576756 /NCGR_PEP_ID=MMETSP0125-20121206/1488_1 /TAXON_ID=485358 ORGANISM="Aristerostoma sp., Strain ATCC 50986" /NCGR_SAMPLE_ID=MMETSP0125 /ASSEMBLY_ACC=CAM_ASM_000245 /LENGTH=68 /DNA_ID=CAMNT_0001765529 /DNA_START=1069 /DNA_END=1275 /DNA_ORIENTATION=+
MAAIEKIQEEMASSTSSVSDVEDNEEKKADPPEADSTKLEARIKSDDYVTVNEESAPERVESPEIIKD